MTCSEAEKYWEQWLSGTPPPELERHLANCPHCRRLSSELARTPGWLALLQEEPPEPSPAFWARLGERLEESERRTDFWQALGWVGGRAALALGALVLFLSLGVVWELSQPAPADFDAPQAFADEPASPADGGASLAVPYGQLDRDQVVLTLVAYTEPQP